MEEIRHDWTMDELRTLYHIPLFELLFRASSVLGAYHDRSVVQVCALISVKTGGCPEDCKYCSQSSRYQTPVEAQPMMSHGEVIRLTKEAIAKGATRICLGAAWRKVYDGKPFEEVLQMVRSINALGAEVCVTLGMLQEHQAKRLKEAGLYAYNHNLDTSASFYPSIVSTRTYQDRLNTIDVVHDQGLSVCCGGILGLGETLDDRLMLLQTLSTRRSHPESVPINRLVAIPGTPLEGRETAGFWEFLRIIATTRIIMPRAMVRLSAGRNEMSLEQQALCFMAGANSIHSERLLTTPTHSLENDDAMFQLFNLTKQKAFTCTSA